MSDNITFTMIKPDAVSNGYTGKIIDHIINAGYKIKAMKYLWLTKEQASQFYSVHSERPFYNDLVSFMCSGPIVAAVLEKANAVADFRITIGATDPQKLIPEPSVNYMQNRLMQMLCTEVIATRMQLSNQASFSIVSSVSKSAHLPDGLYNKYPSCN